MVSTVVKRIKEISNTSSEFGALYDPNEFQSVSFFGA